MITKHDTVIFYYISIDTNTYYQDPSSASIPPVIKTTTFTRSDMQKKGCREGGYWVSQDTQKRICLINRYDYKYNLKEPVYPCTLEKQARYWKNFDITIFPVVRLFLKFA